MTDEGHRFEITVRMAGEDCNYATTLVPLHVRAWNLYEALCAATSRPFPEWFTDDDEITIQKLAPRDPLVRLYIKHGALPESKP